jgi:hypothetical protein
LPADSPAPCRETNLLNALPRELWLQNAAALLAAIPGAFALRMARGPVLMQLCIAGLAFGITYLGGLRPMGVFPPVRIWIPQKEDSLVTVAKAAVAERLRQAGQARALAEPSRCAG